MSKRSDLLKSVIKQNASDKPTFGTDPRDPWSAKANISEDAVLNTFLKSRGLNPLHVTKDQKVAHSKMGEFLKWKKNHMFDRPVSEQSFEHTPTGKRANALKKAIHVNKEMRSSMPLHAQLHSVKTEEVDKKDMVCLDIPLLIRVLEFTREEMKTDIELHNMVERLINMRHDVPLDMSHYDEITQKLVKENHIAIAMGKMLDDESGMVLTQIEELERGCAMIRSYIGKDYEKQLPAWVQAKITLATDYMSTVGNYLVSKNEDVKEAHDPWKDKHFGPTKIIKQKYHVKTDTKSYNVKADNEEHAHKLVTKHAPGSKIVSIEHKGRMMEEIEQIDEISKELTHSYFKKRYAQTGATRQDKPKGMPRATHDKQLMGLHRAMRRLTTTLVLPKGTDPSEGGKYTADSVEIDGTPIQEGSAALRLAQALRKEREARELKDKSREAAERNEKARETQQPVKENTLDAKAATEAPCDCANNPDDVAPQDKNKKLIQMSKSARIIKNLYKQKGMKEEVLDETWKYHQYNSKSEASAARNAHHSWRDEKGMASGNPARLMPGNKVAYKGEFKGPKPMKEETFDSEKEDKSIATYGKKPKVSDNTKKIDTAGKTQAAAIMTGGTTLTGTPRDTIEIDPMMKLKPGLIGQTKK